MPLCLNFREMFYRAAGQPSGGSGALLRAGGGDGGVAVAVNSGLLLGLFMHVRDPRLKSKSDYY